MRDGDIVYLLCRLSLGVEDEVDTHEAEVKNEVRLHVKIPRANF